MIKHWFNCFFKPKIKLEEITFTEYDLIQNKIRIQNESIKIITDSFKEKYKIYNNE